MCRLVVLLIGLCLGIADATTVKPFAFDGLCGTAQTIAYVRCIETGSMVYPDREGIFTQTRFEVLEVVKGIAGSELVLVLPGGTFHGRRMEVFGMPRFAVGQETVLFLSEPDAHGFPWPVGLGQGCYGVAVEAEGSRQVAVGEGTPLPAGARGKLAVSQRMELGAFLGLVRQVVQETPKSSGVEK